MRFLFASVLALWAMGTTRLAMEKWARRRRQIACSLCTAPLRPAEPGEQLDGPYYCGKCPAALERARQLYAKLERKAR